MALKVMSIATPTNKTFVVTNAILSYKIASFHVLKVLITTIQRIHAIFEIHSCYANK